MKTLTSFILGVGLVTLLLCLMFMGSVAAHTQQPTCHVPDDYSTIQDAVNDAACSVIEVEKGNFPEHIKINRTLTINGRGAADTIIDGTSSGRVIEVQSGTSLTLTHLSIINGLSPFQQGSGIRQPGAGILMADGQLFMAQTHVSHNNGGSGAGIHIDNTTLILQDSEINNNLAEAYNAFQGGGALFVGGNSDVQIIRTAVHDNQSIDSGGGLRIAKGKVTITDSTFTNNSSLQGGAIDNSLIGYEGKGAQVLIENSTFEDNFTNGSPNAGAAIFNGHDAQMIIVSTLFSHNKGTGSNIGNDGRLTIQNSQIVSNTNAGLQNDYNGTLSIELSEFRENYNEYGHGGALRNHGEVTITETIFSANRSNYNGGAIKNERDLTIIDSLFKENLSLSMGGAICSSDEGQVFIEGSSFIGNVGGGTGSDTSGGAIANEDGQMTIDRSSIVGNRSASTGGAIFNDDQGELTITNSTISHNSSGMGGAIFNDSNGIIVLKNDTLYGNQAQYEGNSLHSGWNNEPQLNIVNSIIIDGHGDNCAGQFDFTSMGHNIFSDDSCDPIAADHTNLIVTLLPLSDNDGRSLIYQLLPGSLAIDAGRDDMCPEWDQRGTLRPLDGDQDGSPICDIGAYEFDPANPPIFYQAYLPGMWKQ